MFKNKEIRDNILLIGMALVILFFLGYIFFPFGAGKDAENKDGEGDTAVSSSGYRGRFPAEQTKPVFTGRPVDAAILAELAGSLEKELVDIYLTIISSTAPFNRYSVENLEKIINESTNDILQKYVNFSFFDLSDILDFEFPAGYPKELKFNIYLSMFLLKAGKEQVAKKMAAFSSSDFAGNLDFAPYSLLDNEIEKDYQALPVLFYFKVFLNRLDVYPANDDGAIFREKLEKIRDLSSSKHLLRMIDFLRFSREDDSYHIEWVEHDVFPDADDRQSYTGLKLVTMNFLKQRYVIFPCPGPEVQNNAWIRDIAGADAGSIELRELRIANENPVKNRTLRKILYSNLRPMFVVILEECNCQVTEFVDRIAAAGIERFQQNYEIVTFPGQNYQDEAGDESFITALESFGNFLKKLPLPGSGTGN